jgi:hypothetical protein
LCPSHCQPDCTCPVWPPCADTYPECNGACPEGSACAPRGGGSCWCSSR